MPTDRVKNKSYKLRIHLKKREQQGSLVKLVFGRISITCNMSNFKDDICNLLC